MVPGMKKGRLIEMPLKPCSEKMLADEDFLKTKLGKKAVACAQIYLHKKQIQNKTASQLLLEQENGGTCLGESYALLIAYSKLKTEKKEVSELLKIMKKIHVIFFQLLEDLADIERIYTGNSITDILQEKMIDKCGLKKVRQFSSFQQVSKELFTMNEKGAFKRMVTVLSKQKDKIIEIGLYWEKEAHSVLAVFTEDFLFYDNILGLGVFPFKTSSH